MLLLVGAGGATGAVFRYLVAMSVMRFLGPGFPWGTLVVNVVGSFLIGVLIELGALKWNLSQEWLAFLVIGVLGGFTTFSAFSLDAVSLYQHGQTGAAAAYVVGSVVLAIGALFGGLALARAMA